MRGLNPFHIYIRESNNIFRNNQFWLMLLIWWFFVLAPCPSTMGEAGDHCDYLLGLQVVQFSLLLLLDQRHFFFFLGANIFLRYPFRIRFLLQLVIVFSIMLIVSMISTICVFIPFLWWAPHGEWPAKKSFFPISIKI